MSRAPLRFRRLCSSDAWTVPAGFYYVQMRRSDGDVTAYYCDPKSAPYQRLDLSVKRESLGRASAAYEFR